MKLQSLKTSSRLESIKEAIKEHQKNIKLLKKYFRKTMPIHAGEFSPRKVSYFALPYNEKQFQWSIENLESQIKDLEKERLVIFEYGV
jgi:hypothetical protein